jgi:hypothetical protein
MFSIKITDRKATLHGEGLKESSITSNRTLLYNIHEILNQCYDKHESVDFVMKDKELKQICINELSIGYNDDLNSQLNNKFKTSKRINNEVMQLFCKMARDGCKCRINFEQLMSFSNQSYSTLDGLLSLMNNSKAEKTELGKGVAKYLFEATFYINDFLSYYESEIDHERSYDTDKEHYLVKDMMRILSLVYLYEFYVDNETLLGTVCAHGMHHTIIAGYINQLNTGRKPPNVSEERLDILLREYLLYVLQRK